MTKSIIGKVLNKSETLKNQLTLKRKEDKGNNDDDELSSDFSDIDDYTDKLKQTLLEDCESPDKLHKHVEQHLGFEDRMSEDFRQTTKILSDF